MSSPYSSMYGTSNSQGLELNLRNEFNRTLIGAVDEIEKARIGLLRRMRRDSDGLPIRCPCRDKQTDESDRDSYCRVCHSMGFLWDEYKMLYYKNESSFVDGTGFLFYLQYDKDIDTYDYLVEVNVDRNGELTSPIERKAIFNISNARSFKADNGRIEYWQVTALEERKWSVHYGVKNRQY